VLCARKVFAIKKVFVIMAPTSDQRPDAPQAACAERKRAKNPEKRQKKQAKRHVQRSEAFDLERSVISTGSADQFAVSGLPGHGRRTATGPFGR
jgi:hypothetical protein